MNAEGENLLLMSTTSLPPGFRTSAISETAASGSSRNLITLMLSTSSNASSLNGRLDADAQHKVLGPVSRVALHGPFQIVLGEVHPDDLGRRREVDEPPCARAHVQEDPRAQGPQGLHDRPLFVCESPAGAGGGIARLEVQRYPAHARPSSRDMACLPLIVVTPHKPLRRCAWCDAPTGTSPPSGRPRGDRCAKDPPLSAGAPPSCISRWHRGSAD